MKQTQGQAPSVVERRLGLGEVCEQECMQTEESGPVF